MKKNLLISSLIFFSFLTFFILFFGGKSIQKETHYLPNNYIGSVFIIFNKEKGSIKELTNDRRIYRIPENGIFITRFKPNTGWIEKGSDISFYYVDSNGTPIRSIPYIYKVSYDKIVNRNDVGVPWTLYGNVNVENKNITYMTYIVDTLNIIQEKYSPGRDASNIVKNAILIY